MKVKTGFASYAKSKVPLKHPLSKEAKTSLEPKGKLLPHGFRVGERVYYIEYDNTPTYGTVVDHESPSAGQIYHVWCLWGRIPHRPTYMPKNRVFKAGTYQL
jgi:hypothetical protein